ncbi:DUF1737 domain-containing protein [Streptomyces murinus]|uniref:DUF1737 domain-containing protein n=1 Tax=Streptomyces murinus TaxID=33900 RepID=UPI0036E4B29F
MLARHEHTSRRPPVCRVLTDPDGAAFCHRVSEALALGYELHGGRQSPSTANGASWPRRWCLWAC